jgi:hypothetical protein
MNDEQIAKVIHEVNRAYYELLGDLSQPTWDDAPKWQRASTMNGIEFLHKNPAALLDQLHTNWLREKIKDGWKYGPVKNPAKKEHPYMVLYNELPLEQKNKDYLFRAIVRQLLMVKNMGVNDD